MALANAMTFSGSVVWDSEWERRTTKGVLPEAIEVWASLQLVFECLRLLLAQVDVRLEERCVSCS